MVTELSRILIRARKFPAKCGQRRQLAGAMAGQLRQMPMVGGGKLRQMLCRRLLLIATAATAARFVGRTAQGDGVLPKLRLSIFKKATGTPGESACSCMSPMTFSPDDVAAVA